MSCHLIVATAQFKANNVDAAAAAQGNLLKQLVNILLFYWPV